MSTLIDSIKVSYRHPNPADGADMWRLVKRSGKLDLNSAYCYLLLSKYFDDSCMLAEFEGKVIGFVSAFCPPNKPESLFVWQIAVSEKYRGNGIGYSLLYTLLMQDKYVGVSFLETTISPDNQASKALFYKIARDFSAPCIISEGFPSHMFPAFEHESELLYTIGPLKLS